MDIDKERHVSPANQYKIVENKVAFLLAGKARRGISSIIKLFKRIIQIGSQRFTVMLIPHSEKKIFNFKMSVFSLIFISILLVGILVSFLLFSTQFTGLNKLLTQRSDNLDSSEASLEAIRDELYEFRRGANELQDVLSETRDTLGLQNTQRQQPGEGDGDIASFFRLEEQDESLAQELSELRSLSESVTDSVDMIRDVGSVLESHRALLVNLPTFWPVAGRVRITNRFGFSKHPITGVTYLHKGIDIGKAPGEPILAAANGEVVQRKFDRGGFGNLLVIKHAYGIYTRYGHLDKVDVQKGDRVVQGQKIGTMGNSGLSTGFHLHFEIKIGDQVTNPLIFLGVRDGVSFIKTAR